MAMNPMQILGMIRSSKNPQEKIKEVVSQDPIAKRTMEMTEGKSEQEIQQVCKNICNQMGVDFEKAKEQFSSQFGMKL